VLPLLRRTFGAFAAPERRAIGEQVRRLGAATAAAAAPDAGGVDQARAEPAVHAVARILGLLPFPAGAAAGPDGEVAGDGR
jgi:hypothetical protein